MPATFLTINFIKEHTYTWSGTINNEKVKNKAKAISKIAGSITEVSKELLINEAMLGQLVLLMPIYDLKITFADIIKVESLFINISGEELKISGKLIAKKSLKPEALAILKEKTNNTFIESISIWLPERDMVRNGYRFDICSDWDSSVKHRNSIQENGVDESSFKLLLSDKKPK